MNLVKKWKWTLVCYIQLFSHSIFAFLLCNLMLLLWDKLEQIGDLYFGYIGLPISTWLADSRGANQWHITYKFL